LDDGVAYLCKVVGYVKRHLTQRPSGGVTDTAGRYSLMNSGPLPDEVTRMEGRRVAELGRVASEQD
jgi:hypothetical protein